MRVFGPPAPADAHWGLLLFNLALPRSACCLKSDRICASVLRRRACRIVDVHYVIANDGSDHTLAQLTLSLTDAASSLKVRHTGGGRTAVLYCRSMPASQLGDLRLRLL